MSELDIAREALRAHLVDLHGKSGAKTAQLIDEVIRAHLAAAAAALMDIAAVRNAGGSHSGL